MPVYKLGDMRGPDDKVGCDSLAEERKQKFATLIKEREKDVEDRKAWKETLTQAVKDERAKEAELREQERRRAKEVRRLCESVCMLRAFLRHRPLPSMQVEQKAKEAAKKAEQDRLNKAREDREAMLKLQQEEKQRQKAELERSLQEARRQKEIDRWVNPSQRC